MRPIGFRRHARAGFAAAVLLVVPSAKPNTVTVDLGIVAYSVGVNASINYLATPNHTYTFQQLLFQSGPSLNLTFDSGMTLNQVLANNLGPVNNGTLVYNFPFVGGASGAYLFSGTPILPTPSNPIGNIGPGIFNSFTAQTQSGFACAGFNSIGSTISVDPTNPAATFETVLGCESLGVAVPLSNTSATTVTTLPPLGTITNGSTVTDYVGEVQDTEWGPEGEVLPASSTPEPSTWSLIIAGIVGAYATRLCTRSGTKT